MITDKANSLEIIFSKYGTSIFWINMIASLLLNVVYITDGNLTYTLSFYYFLPLFFMYSCYLYFYKFSHLIAKTGKVKSIVVLFSVVLLGTYFFGSYLIGFNANFGVQKKIEISGEIVNLKTQEGRKGAVNHYVTFIDNQTSQERVVRITLDERNRYQIGEDYKKVWLSGILGVKYLKIWGEGPGTIKSNGA